MNLRTRLLLGYGFLVLLMLIMAMSAVASSQLLTARLTATVDDDIRDLTRLTSMIQLLDDAGAALSEYQRTGDGDIEDLSQAKDELEARLMASMDSSDEAELSEALQHTIEQLRRYESLRVSLDEAGLSAERSLELGAQLQVLVHGLKAGAWRLLVLHRDSALARGDQASRFSQSVLFWIGALVIIALFSIGFINRFLQDQFLSRLADASDVVGQISAGDTRPRLTVGSDDELGALARQLNAALDQQVEAQEAARAKGRHQRQLLLSLLPALSKYALVLGLDGQTIASSFPDRLESRAERIAEWIRSEGNALVNELADDEGLERAFDEPGKPTLVARLLVVRSGQSAVVRSRPVGWLVTYVPRSPQAAVS